jgi:hypothetical protein
MIGEGSISETIVAQALGSGLDGLNSSYTSTTGADGRHFRLTNVPVVSNRTTLFKNGFPLVGLEAVPDSNTFSNKYDYRIDITTGKIELQRAHLQDQGGTFYTALTTNVGLGTVNSLTLLDSNAVPETWTIRCISVQRNTMNQPIAGTATFIAFGSVSGNKLDANGNSIVWVANNQVVSNGILSFSIAETQVSGVTTSPFVPGDAFTVIIASGVLIKSDSLTANYISSSNLNDPVLLQGMNDVVKRHGLPSLTNNLSLGAQLAFANNAPALLTVQAAPPMPRRTSYILDTNVNSQSKSPDAFIFPLPIGVVPNIDSSIHFFVKDNTTGVETQILPNKVTYYTLDTAGNPTTNGFIFDDVAAPAGNSYAYTVKQSFGELNFGEDGYFGRLPAFFNQATFSSSVSFDSNYVGKTLKILQSTNSANFGFFKVTGVSGGKLTVIADGSVISGSTTYQPTYLSDFVNENPVTFSVVDSFSGVAIANGQGTDGILVSSGPATGTATLNSASVNFGAMAGLLTLGRSLKITGSTVTSQAQPVGNNGLYDIIAVSGNQITIRKAIVSESNMQYEVLDPTLVSSFIVINHNVVPNSNALRVTIVDQRDTTFFDAGWINALASLETVECDILVPLPKQTISVIFQNALAHCKAMSNIRNKKERVLFIGAIAGLKPENLTGAKTAAVEDIGVLEGIQGDSVTEVLAGNIEDLANYSVANAFGNTYRAVYFYPDQIVVQAGTDNVLIDGFYIAAAAAGFAAADVRIENPLTNKVLTGFTILRNKQFSTLTLEQLATAGVATLQPVAGGGRVVWGITTSQSGFPEEQEISIVFIRDRVAKIMRAGFAGFIGNAETLDTGAILNTRAVILLNSLVSQGLITAFKDLAVQRDDVDPTQWNISVRIQPVYPVNFIYIKVSVGKL